VRVIGAEDGYSLIELIIVMAILSVIVGGIVSVLASGINANADQTRRYQAQQDARVSLVRMTREIHSACTISSPNTYNTWTNSVTVYFPSDNCASGTHSVTWCTKASGSVYALYRGIGTTCTAATAKYAAFVTASNIFVYLPPNSHLATATSLGGGTGVGSIATIDGAFALPRLHVAFTVDPNPRKRDRYTLIDDITFRNGPRTCGAAATC
jgi:prepilin-type N-terminal cleavage/methylation domain-containing protein